MSAVGATPASALARLRALWRGQPEACLLAVASLVLAVALLRPTLPQRADLVNALLVIDITQSMNVRDAPWGDETLARGEQARRGAYDLMRAAPCGSHIGLGIFNEYRTFVLLAPIEVCANFRELSATLDSIGNRMSWAGASEIAKGLNSGLQTLKALPGKPALVMFTDGHESPPISMLHRPKIDARPGDFAGVLVGTGSLRPQPIPKVDPAGNPIGFWKADEVAQVDIYSQGRETSVPGEKYAEDPADPQPKQPTTKPAGIEHLSSLHEPYLQQLAGETGLGYLRLERPGQLLAALQAAHGTASTRIAGDGRWLCACAALLALLASHLGWEELRGLTSRLHAPARRRVTATSAPR